MSIIILLDPSGSMSSMKNEPVEGVYTFIHEQKKNVVEGYAPKFSLYTFNSVTTPVFENKELHQIPVLTIEKDGNVQEVLDILYEPHGFTAIFDCIWDVLEKHQENDVELVIVTDGQDTSSTKEGKQVLEFLQKRQTEGWKVHYLMAKGNMFDQEIGNVSNVSQAYSPNEVGSFSRMMRITSASISRHRTVKNPDN